MTNLIKWYYKNQKKYTAVLKLDDNQISNDNIFSSRLQLPDNRWSRSWSVVDNLYLIRIFWKKPSLFLFWQKILGASFIVSHGVINQKNVSNTFASFKIQNNEAVVYRYSIKNCSDKFCKNSSENTYTRFSFFIRTQAFYTEKRIRHTFLKNTSMRQFLSYLFLCLGNIKWKW